MTVNKRHIINEFQRSALNGTPKKTLVTEYKKVYKLDDDEIEWIIEACNFNTAPNKINYGEFYNCNITKIAKPIKTDEAQIYCIEKFLSSIDCQLLRGFIEQRATPVVVHTNGAEKDERQRQTNIRNSSTTLIDHRFHSFFLGVDKKITLAMDFHPFLAEAMNGQKYEIGEFYKAHADFFSDAEFKLFGEWSGQRTWTTMLYLNDVEEGGETEFKHLKLKIKPKEGTLLAWNNLNYDGSPNLKTIHEALPPKSGKKYIITKIWKSWNLL